MKIKFRKNAEKFLKKLNEKDSERIRQKLYILITSIESDGVIPFKELDIKKLEGDWSGFFRMRIGKMRLIFRIVTQNDELQVYVIDFRGDVYN